VSFIPPLNNFMLFDITEQFVCYSVIEFSDKTTYALIIIQVMDGILISYVDTVIVTHLNWSYTFSSKFDKFKIFWLVIGCPTTTLDIWYHAVKYLVN